MASGRPRTFTACLSRACGADPAELVWPRAFRLPGRRGSLAAVFDPQNALLTVCGAEPADLGAPAGAWLLAAGAEAPTPCSRLLVFARDDAASAWNALGFLPEGTVDAYWADGQPAVLWARLWGGRSGCLPDGPLPVGGVPRRSRLPRGWICRPAMVPDAADIGALLREVFADYPIPEDPGVIRYALGSGAVHGRLICRPDGRLAAYASLEFQPGDGAVEITDCATIPDERGKGLMSHLVGWLQSDLVDVFDGRAAYSLARVDQPGMQKVLAHCGWQRSGRLVNHFRVGGRWLSANLWQVAGGG